MSVSARALWYIESHLDGDLSLEAVASASGVSRYHLSRAFSLTVVHTIAGYARARRLSEAAKALAGGAPDILEVALAAGYGSHEAFTRAFVAQLGATPEAVRARGALGGLPIQEPLRMQQPGKPLAPPRLVTSPALRIFGLAERHTGTTAGLPAQWGRFAPHLAAIPGRVAAHTLGVVHAGDDAGFTYVCGVEVREFPPQPRDFARVELPPRRYAVWSHREHVSSLHATCVQIFEHGLVDARLDPLEAPFFERYDVDFDPRTGHGGLEIWVPVRV